MKLFMSLFFLLASLSAKANMVTDAIEQDTARSFDSQIDRDGLYQKSRQFERDVTNGHLADQGTKALDRLLRTAALALEQRGHNLEAKEIIGQWESRFNTMLYEIEASRGVGDHPGIDWLLKVHAKVESIIGEDICRALRLHDMWYFAYTIPVTFQCVDKIHISAQEYEIHFAKFTSMTVYWASTIACVFTCPIPFVCGIAAAGLEQLVLRFVAPRISDRFYARACK